MNEWGREGRKGMGGREGMGRTEGGNRFVALQSERPPPEKIAGYEPDR